MKKNRMMIGMIYALLLVAVLLVAFLLKSNQYSTYLIMNNDGYLINHNYILKNMFHKEMELEEASYEAYSFSVSDIVYERSGEYYMGEEKVQIYGDFPLFVNNESALLNLTDTAVLISDNFEQAKTYSGLYINNGLSFNPDMERAYREEFILLALSNGLYVNSKTIKVSGNFFQEKILHNNSIIRFMENEIRYYSLEEGNFTPAIIRAVNSNTMITIDRVSYSYYDFLEKLGIYEKGELLEKEAENLKKEQDNIRASATPLPEEEGKTEEGQLPIEAEQITIETDTKKPVNPEQGERIAPTPQPFKVTKTPSVTDAATKAEEEEEEGERKQREPKEREATDQELKLPEPAAEAELPGLPEEVSGVNHTEQSDSQSSEEPEQKPEEKPGNLNWKMPKVTLGSFSTSVYTIKSPGMVIENSEFLYRTGISFSIYQGSKLVMKKSYLASADVSIGPLQPDTEFKIVVEMDYYDKFGVRKTEAVTQAEVHTKPLSDLVPLRLNWTNGSIFYNKLQLMNLSITNAVSGVLPQAEALNAAVDRNLYIETAQYISRVEVLLSSKQNASIKYTMLIGSKDLINLRTGVQLLYETAGRIASNTEYSYEFLFYDRYGNILPLEGVDRGESHTCKQPPKAEVTITKNEVKDIVMSILVKNPDHADITEGSIRFSIFDRNDNPIKTTISRKDKKGIYQVQKEQSESHELDAEGNTIEFHDLLDYEVYKIRVYCDYDINNNLGFYENATIGEMSFTTMPISSLGYAFFRVEVQELKDNSAAFRISLDTGKTDSRLVNLLSNVDISFTDAATAKGNEIEVTYYKEGDPVPADASSEEGSVALTEQELAQLKSVDASSGVSTSYLFRVNKLKSNTKYNINIVPKVMMGTINNQVYRKIDTYYTPSSFMTLKKSPVIEIDAIYASSDFIKLYGVKVNDPDGAVVSYPVTVAVFDDKNTQIAAYEITSGEKVSAIDITRLTRDRVYTFRFFAREFNNGFDMASYRKNYELYYASLFDTKEHLKVTTKEAVSGTIYLQGLDDVRLNKSIEIPAKSIRSYNPRVTLYQNYRFGSNSQIKAKYSLEVNFGQELWNSFQIGYSYVNRATDYKFYLSDPDTNPGIQPFATYRVNDPTRGSEACRWTEVSFLENGFTLSGTKTIYVVATTFDGSGGINCLWGFRFHKAETSSQGSLYADINSLVSDPKAELGGVPAYKLKIYKDGIWIDTRRHEWKANADGTYTLNMYQVAPDQTLTLVETKVFSGGERFCDTNFYYEVQQGHHTYRFELWAAVYNYEIQLGEEEFTTEEEIIGIRTADELADVRYGLGRKYYVLKDITFPLGWNNITASQSFNGELDFRGHTLTYNSTANLISTMGYYGSLKNLVFTYVDGWGSDVERKTDRIVTYNYGTISNIFVSRNNGNVMQTYKVDAAAICHTNYESGVIENFVVEFPDSMIVTNYSGGVCVYNRGIIRNGYVYGKPIKMTPKDNITEDQFTNNNILGGIVCVNRQTGILENVYSLIDIETRAVKSVNDYAFNLAGINDGTLRNSFSSGNVYYGGEIRQDYGPAYRNRYAGSNVKNVFYFSEKNYGNTNNKLISKLLLHDMQWYDRIFNASGSSSPNQMNLGAVQMGYYPQVVWPHFMPVQANNPLPVITEEDQLEIIDTTIVEQGQDFAKAVITFDNPDHFEITELKVRWLTTAILAQEVDGEFYRVTVRLTQPEATKYYSEYEITEFTYSLGFRGLERSKLYETGTEPRIPAEFYKPITKVEEWFTIKDDYGQNYRLEADLDFRYIDSKVLVIPANLTLATTHANFYLDAFTGKLNGNGYKIIGANTGAYGYVIGKLSGTVKNLTVEDLDLVNGNCQFKGFIGRMLEGSLVDNVHVIGMKAESYEHCGAIAGDVYAGTIVNSSAHKVKISTKADGNYVQYVGGLIGKHRQSGSNTIYANVSLQNCYVDGVDIQVLEAGDCGGVGGLVGFVRASAEIHNVYVVNGAINTVYKNAGGLIGSIDTYTNSESNRYMLKDYYVDVDITSITERCGGIIGFCIVENGELEEENGLVLGNVVTSIPNSKETGRFYGYNPTIVTKPATAVYGYEYSILNGMLPSEEDIIREGASGEEGSGTKPELLSYATLCKEATYELDGALYWDESFIRNAEEIKAGILPKLSFIGSSEPLPYQSDYQLEQEPITIKRITSRNYSTGNLYIVKIELEHGPEIEITGAVFRGFKEAGLANPEDAVKISLTPTGTDLEYVLALDGYYDAYYLTELGYKKIATGEGRKQFTYLNVGIAPQYLKIADKDQWNTLLAKENFGLKRYNIQIDGNIDFSQGSAASGIVVNHIMGANLDKNNYYKISGINMDSQESIFKAVYGNVSYLNFEDITLRKPTKLGNDGKPEILNSFGILEAVTGEIHDVNFKNININAIDSAYVGIAGLTYGLNYNIGLSGVTIHDTFNSNAAIPVKRAVGGLTGRLSGSGGIYDTEATDIIVEGRDYVGGIVGTQEEGRYLSNISINRGAVYSTNCSYSYVGGIIGHANVYALSNIFSNCSVKNTVVIGNSYVGGVVGIGSPMGDYIKSGVEKDGFTTLAQQVFVSGTGSYIGGIAGQGVVQRGVVRNAQVYGISYIGGITGNGSGYYDYVTDSTIGSVYDRMEGDTSNTVFRKNVNDKIQAYQKLIEASTDPVRNKVYEEAKKVLGYLLSTSRTTAWSASSFTGTNNTRIGGISGRTISVANSMVVNSRIGSFGAIAVGGIVSRTELSSYNTGTYRIISSGTQNCEIYGAEDVGGIVGSHLRAYIESCYSNSNVTATRGNAGGIAGRVKATNLYSLSETPYFSKLFYMGTVKAPDYVGGIVGKMEQDLYNVNQGLLVGGNVIVTSPTGTASFFMNKYINDTRSLTDCLIYENAAITFGTASQAAKAYYQANPHLLLRDEISLTTTAELKLRGTYTNKLGWNTDEGTSSSNYTNRYFKYNGLLNGYMPYLSGAPTNNYNMATSIKVLPFQEGYQPDKNAADQKALVDEEGLYVYKYEAYDGGIPIPGSGAAVVGKRMLLRPISNTVPRAEFYTVDADKFNIEFNDINEGATFTIMANGIKVAEQKVDRRTFTVHYDFKSELEIIVTDGLEDISYTLWPEDISRNVMTWDADYYYIKANEIAGNKEAIRGQFLNLYAGYALDVYGRVFDVRTGERSRIFDRIRLAEEITPLHSFTFDGYTIQTFKNYSLVGNVIRDKLRMYVKDGELSAISSTLSMVMDSLLLDNYNGNKYCSVLSVDGMIVDMTDASITFPEEFDNQDIQYMTNNLNSSNHLLLVRYYDGAVAGFNYITGELLPIDSPRGTATMLVDKNGLTKPSANVSMTNFATLYVDAMEFKTNITDIGWAEVSGVNLVSGEAVSEVGATITMDSSAVALDASSVPMYVENTFKLDDGSTVAAGITASAATGNLAGSAGLSGTAGEDKGPGAENIKNPVTAGENYVPGVAGVIGDASKPGTTGLPVSGELQARISDEQEAMSLLNEVLNSEELINVAGMTGQDSLADIACILAAVAVVEKYGASPEEIAKIEVMINNLSGKGVMQAEIDRLLEALKSAATKYGLTLADSEEVAAGDTKGDRKEAEEGADKDAEKAAEGELDEANLEQEPDQAIRNLHEEEEDADKLRKASIKEAEKGKQYIAVYDTVKNEYVIYEKDDLLTKEDEKLESVNEKVKRSGHMIDYKAKQKADIKNPGDENLYGYILLSLAIVGIASLFSILLIKKQKEAVE